MKHIEETTLRTLQTFTSVEEMNEAIQIYKKVHPLTKTDHIILDTISRYACKYTGVCYLRKQSIALEAGFKSKRTAIRACNRMEQLGVIKQYETRRISGDKRRSVNIIVIQPEKIDTYKEAQSPQDVTAQSHGKEALSKTYNKANTYKETWEDTEYAYKRGLKSQIPGVFYEAFEPFFNAKELYEVYGILLRAKASVKPLFMLEDYAEEYVDYFFNEIRLYKWGKIQNLQGYLYRTWEWLTLQLHRQMLIEQRMVPDIYYLEE